MPHYKDGSEAKIGDQVYGKLYNTEGLRAGTILSITPGVESCNALVGFQMTMPLDGESKSTVPRMALVDSNEPGTTTLVYRKRRARTEQHGSAGPEVDIYDCADYSATNELTRVGP
jgi:hypothetical protein